MSESYNTLYGLPEPPAQPIPAKPVENFAKKEQILACSSLLAGFLFIRLCCYHVTGVLTTLLFWLLFTLCIVYLKKSGKSFTKGHKALAAVLFLFAAVYTITANPFLKFLNTVFLLLTCCLFVYNVCQTGDHFRFLPYTLEKAIFSHPFAGFGKCPAAAVSTVKRKSSWKNVLYVLGGLVLTVPLTGIVAMLLCSADDGMADLLERLIFEPSDEMLMLIPHLLTAFPVGCWFFGMLFHNAMGSHCESLSTADCERRILGMRIFPNPMLYAAVTPLCILYVLFFVSQFQYFLGGFTGELADGFTYAQYARKGFFELCAVCCINFAVIGVMSFGAKLCGAVKPLVLKLYTLFLSVCSLILAGTAMAKMFLYISTYGMTQLRVYTTWFMVLLIIGFVLIIIRQFRISLPVCKIGFILFTVMFGLLCFSRPDAWMTRYNVEMYLAGELRELDTDMISSEMSADAAAVLSTYQHGELASYNLEESEVPTVDGIIQRHLYACERDPYQNLNLSAWILRVNGVTAE